jgi:hypothetical protein
MKMDNEINRIVTVRSGRTEADGYHFQIREEYFSELEQRMVVGDEVLFESTEGFSSHWEAKDAGEEYLSQQ